MFWEEMNMDVPYILSALLVFLKVKIWHFKNLFRLSYHDLWNTMCMSYRYARASRAIKYMYMCSVRIVMIEKQVKFGQVMFIVMPSFKENKRNQANRKL